ncbi:unnamed protein product [Prorocentrum cordatum]|uniref:Ion transport domain-containing protein n=1 Tax=Prorocentrum cordatum TaxID=2364126 RepID=A0ABN9PSX9_9DINO|nr:unnamed protein product [Polarella glacialis]
MGLLIILNTVSVGVEIQSSLDGDTAVQGVLDILENILLLGFLVELVIRMMANGWDCWSNLWFLTDFVLVFVGVIAAWVVKPALHISSNSVEELDLIQQLLVVRILRLIRLVRAMRLIDYFQELWKLTKGLITSGRTVISALIMVIIVIYGFACLGVEVIYNSEVLRADPATAFILETRFSSLPSTMLTLGAFANADSVASIYVPLCQVQPWLVFYFCCLWLVVTVSLMNLVTAVADRRERDCWRIRGRRDGPQDDAQAAEKAGPRDPGGVHEAGHRQRGHAQP